MNRSRKLRAYSMEQIIGLGFPPGLSARRGGTSGILARPGGNLPNIRDLLIFIAAWAAGKSLAGALKIKYDFKNGAAGGR